MNSKIIFLSNYWMILIGPTIFHFMIQVNECILWLSIIFITILCTPQPTIVRWSATPPVSDEIQLQWKGFCALIANAYFGRGMAWWGSLAHIVHFIVQKIACAKLWLTNFWLFFRVHQRLPVKTLQLEQMAVVGRAEEPSVVASRMRLVFSTLEVSKILLCSVITVVEELTNLGAVIWFSMAFAGSKSTMANCLAACYNINNNFFPIWPMV